MSTPFVALSIVKLIAYPVATRRNVSPQLRNVSLRQDERPFPAHGQSPGLHETIGSRGGGMRIYSYEISPTSLFAPSLLDLTSMVRQVHCSETAGILLRRRMLSWNER